MTTPDKRLFPVLAKASNEDLGVLVEYILKEAPTTEELTTNPTYKQYYPDHQKYTDLIEKEIRLFGGNTFANTARGEGPQYYEIVCNVADKLKAKYEKNDTIEEVEQAIILRVIGEAYEKMTPEERSKFIEDCRGAGDFSGDIPKAAFMAAAQAGIKMSGFFAYKTAVIVANAVAKAILGRGLAFATNAAITRCIGLFAGPIGWVITGLWTLADIAGPAFRVTIPCVIHIAMLRLKPKEDEPIALPYGQVLD